jgi:hypothetical protein
MTAGYGTAVADGVRPENPGFFNVTAQDVKKVHGQAINIIWNEMRVWTLDQFIPQQQATENGNSETSAEPQEILPVWFHVSRRIWSPHEETSKTLMLDPSTRGPYKTTSSARFQTAVWNANTTVYERVYELIYFI